MSKNRPAPVTHTRSDVFLSFLHKICRIPVNQIPANNRRFSFAKEDTSHCTVIKRCSQNESSLYCGIQFCTSDTTRISFPGAKNRMINATTVTAVCAIRRIFLIRSFFPGCFLHPYCLTAATSTASTSNVSSTAAICSIDMLARIAQGME